MFGSKRIRKGRGETKTGTSARPEPSLHHHHPPTTNHMCFPYAPLVRPSLLTALLCLFWEPDYFAPLLVSTVCGIIETSTFVWRCARGATFSETSGVALSHVPVHGIVIVRASRTPSFSVHGLLAVSVYCVVFDPGIFHSAEKASRNRHPEKKQTSANQKSNFLAFPSLARPAPPSQRWCRGHLCSSGADKISRTTPVQPTSAHHE